MKKTILKSIAAVAILTISVGCGNDFLEKSPTGFINVEDYNLSGSLNPDVLDGTLRGVYSTMINPETGGTTNDGDFGQKGYDIYSDMLSGDMALSLSSYGYYRSLTTLEDTVDYTRLTNYRPWRYYYRIVRGANLIINGLGDAQETVEAKYALGQAKALRAYAYFYLSQYYIKEYNPSTKVLPIYTNPKTPNVAQSTTKEVYEQMISDLESSITLLNGFVRGTKNQVNSEVAKGLLAYVYGAMNTTESNAKSLALLNEVVNTGSFKVMSKDEVVGGFDDVNINGWIWGADLTTDMNFGLVSWWGQMDVYTYSYQWAGDKKSIDQDLYDAIDATDIRKTQFNDNKGTSNHLIPNNKFYHQDKEIGGQQVVTTDYVFMRISEIYLLSAEMAAKTGNETLAKDRLKAIVSKRMPDASYIDALSGKALLDEIYFQTRVELWGEGKSYLAMKRNKATIKRGDNHLSLVGKEIPYNDERLTFEIPQSEIQNNPFIN
ncbi:RagB/SusD family nutrient uptake outer membrane protein [Tenacibaculum finnmarkense]|uniref:RagB/SusD family nutrient uptake outer membrane protein n=1 Tax=Tenacibaculum finnmarkense TaxID=2781243 RepID=UPI00073901EF|nr:RagB/SusD family nutrient uptake outer membrane protein [Tenacibaculum finnmarkense]ALU75520.1 glycan metabolism protein RagB [Tenacibaculum dicentrarchi]MBE7644576.1 RagB/SusD family nutrient uptake outer membrane protein [Tenacibaculum finnmarkense genomovar ulcerans]MBE7687832.1 RagB/SusD family nutrient uptake outer membrane protein [Tenacibaculum finnmarkense genomovar ulcerans]MCD8422070.1 RagB/SusD family nutrient uptake outer membrane protein [Tenacibaculum finnmarkense genomovar ulc